MATLQEIRAKLQAQNTRKESNSSSGPSDNYPFWNIPTDSSARVRFLPDGNEDNTFFWVEKQIIRLEFPGIKGDDEGKTVRIDVPCVEMWGESCPILTETRPWWNDESLKPMASKYWKKRSYIFQGLVIEDPLKEDETPENPIRRFVIGKQIFNIIKTSLLDPEFETIPTDFVSGTDFTITKGEKGGFADYSASKWCRKETALTEDQLEAVKEYGLKDLSEYLPKKPTPEQLAAIFEMFEASVAGELYDPDRWAKHYRPYGFNYQEDSTPKVSVEAAPVAEPAPADDDGSIKFDVTDSVKGSAEETESAPAPAAEAEAAADGSNKSAEDILKMIRDRNKS